MTTTDPVCKNKKTAFDTDRAVARSKSDAYVRPYNLYRPINLSISSSVSTPSVL